MLSPKDRKNLSGYAGGISFVKGDLCSYPENLYYGKVFFDGRHTFKADACDARWPVYHSYH